MTFYQRVPGINERILFEKASQRLRHEAHGVPSGTMTCYVYDSRYDREDTDKNPIVSGSATLVSCSLTLTAAAGPTQTDPRNIPCVTTGVSYGTVAIGDPLWLENSYHQKERIIVAKWGAAAIGAADPLVFAYATNDTLKTAILYSPELPTAWVSDEDNIGRDYYAEWSYTLDGYSVVTRTRWDLTRELQDSHIEDSVLFERFPDLKRFNFRAHPDTFLPLVKAAQRDVDALCWQIGVDPNQLRSNERLNYLVEHRAHLLIAENGIRPNGRDTEEYVRRKQAEWDDLSSSVTEGYFKIPVDQDDDDIADDDEVMLVTLVR